MTLPEMRKASGFFDTLRLGMWLFPKFQEFLNKQDKRNVADIMPAYPFLTQMPHIWESRRKTNLLRELAYAD